MNTPDVSLVRRIDNRHESLSGWREFSGAGWRMGVIADR